MDTITIKVRYDFESLFKLFLLITFRRAAIFIIALIAFIVYIIIANLKVASFSDIPFSMFLPLIIIIGVNFLFAWLQARTAFRSTKAFRDEENVYEFSATGIKVSTESSTSSATWDGIFKVVEMNDWFLIYRGSRVFTPIPKKGFGPGEIELLRAMLRNVKGLRLKLR